MKYFIFGTGGFGASNTPQTLPTPVKEKLLSLMEQGVQFLIGDCMGIDYLVQDFLFKHNYEHVLIYVSGRNTRVNIGNWVEYHTDPPKDCKGRAYYTHKDISMREACDAGIGIWDGISKGTKANIDGLCNRGKDVSVFMLSTGDWR